MFVFASRILFLAEVTSSAPSAASPDSTRFRRPRLAHRFSVGGGHRKSPVSQPGAVDHLPLRRLGLFRERALALCEFSGR